MTQDSEITPVIFRRYRKCINDSKAVLAIMPTIPGTDDAMTCTCYEHVGQHGSCDVWRIMNITTAVAENDPEVVALRAELEGEPYGYHFRVYRKMRPRWTQMRKAELAKSCI